jgi:hypothetical protein
VPQLVKAAALLMAAGLALPALAGPRESITFTNVLNDGMRNWIQNEFRECEFQGDYVATKVRISGRIRALVPGQSLLETQIAIGAPDWNIVWVYPFGEMVDEYDTFTLVDSEFELESPVRASGEWAFQFFDTADDPNGPDAVWETVTLTLDDAPPPPDVFYEYLSIDSGDTITTALEARGEGALHEIRGFGGPSDADLYRIRITDPSSFLAEAQLIRYFGDGATLCLFDSRGKGLIAIDSRTPTTPRLDDAVVTLAPGDYYLGIATSHRFPVDVAGERIWDDTINTQQVPNGPGRFNALHHWEGSGETIQYHIRLTGADYVGLPNTCTADYNHDGDFGTDQDIEAFFRCLAGDCCTDCISDFNGDGDYGTDQDVEAFFRVLSGAPC